MQLFNKIKTVFTPAKKAMSHSDKFKLIQQYIQQGNHKLFVETGTYSGEMVEKVKDHFDVIYSIELSEEMYQYSCRRFEGIAKINLINGDSGKELKKLMPVINQPAIFWLDGHYSGGITALGDKETPILEELESIMSAGNCHHIILIDDARLFIGENDYPTIGALKKKVTELNPGATVEVYRDIIICKPGGHL